MTRRSGGREVAVQLLFQREHNARMDRAGGKEGNNGLDAVIAMVNLLKQLP